MIRGDIATPGEGDKYESSNISFKDNLYYLYLPNFIGHAQLDQFVISRYKGKTWMGNKVYWELGLKKTLQAWGEWILGYTLITIWEGGNIAARRLKPFKDLIEHLGRCGELSYNVLNHLVNNSNKYAWRKKQHNG